VEIFGAFLTRSRPLVRRLHIAAVVGVAEFLPGPAHRRCRRTA
jgi:hypothetical protein